jgi:hypothetical protein
MRGTIALAFLLLLIASEAVAQLSDNELFASYCFGVLEQRDRSRSEALAMRCDGQTCEGINRQLLKERASEAEQLARLRQYLFIRQASTPNPTAMNLLVLVKQTEPMTILNAWLGELPTLKRNF